MTAAAWLVWDLGNVLVPSWDLGALAGSVGADPQRFAAAYWAHREPYDRGAPAHEYWRQVLADAGASSCDGPDGDEARGPREPDDVLLDRLAEQDAYRWTRLAPQTDLLLADLHAAAVPMALLSNAPLALGVAVRACAWSRWFAHVVISAEEGVSKPEPAVYALVQRRLETPPSTIVFFDDRVENVEAAVAAGWQGHLWEGVPAARRVLAVSGLLPG